MQALLKRADSESGVSPGGGHAGRGFCQQVRCVKTREAAQDELLACFGIEFKTRMQALWRSKRSDEMVPSRLRKIAASCFSGVVMQHIDASSSNGVIKQLLADVDRVTEVKHKRAQKKRDQKKRKRDAKKEKNKNGEDAWVKRSTEDELEDERNTTADSEDYSSLLSSSPGCTASPCIESPFWSGLSSPSYSFDAPPATVPVPQSVIEAVASLAEVDTPKDEKYQKDRFLVEEFIKLRRRILQQRWNWLTQQNK
eukprot:GHVL01017693.1.p1 GENE.GHVL01017693.1~~GHVL01017693.1.p1  ORF type:complete len:254 (+),score=59.46 GHVL01017693.1:992-1753(+)